jgi:hypothetical protein
MPRRDSWTKFYEGNGNKRKRGLPRGKKLKRRKYLQRKAERDRLARMYNPVKKIDHEDDYNPKKGKGNINHNTRRDGHQAAGRYRRNEKGRVKYGAGSDKAGAHRG